MSAVTYEFKGWTLVRLDGQPFLSSNPPGIPFAESKKDLLSQMHSEQLAMVREGLLEFRSVRMTVDVEEEV